uniref:Deoxyribonuclease n=1 Tax=Pelodiscus sinensis TaxID=13735 RepID=K7FMV4_PELSI
MHTIDDTHKHTQMYLPIPLLLLLLCPGGTPFRICTFHLQRFAGPKAAKPPIMATLVKIISRCDIAVLQEDAKGQAVPALLHALNGTVSPESYSALSSPPLDIGRYREHYVFVYQSSRTQVLDAYMYPDESPARPDTFSRDPFLARFSLPSKALPALVLVPLHMVPTKAELVVDTLYDVFLELQAQWGAQDVMFLGDFNADCGYVAKKGWGQIRLRGARAPAPAPVTPFSPRIVVHGERLLGLVVPGSAQPFDFPTALGLTEAEALEVSDHYPVE